MIQPIDPPPRAEPVEPAALQPAPEPRPQPVVVLHAPRPMYECVRDDGSRYTSDDGEGNPRWISSWSSYGGPWRRGSGITYGRGQATPAATTTPPRGGSTSSGNGPPRSEEHTSELQSLMRISYAVFCLKNTSTHISYHHHVPHSPPLN